MAAAPKKELIGLRVLCFELVAEGFGGTGAGLSLGQEWVWLGNRRGFLVTWEVGGGGEEESFLFLTALSQGIGTAEFSSVCV